MRLDQKALEVFQAFRSLVRRARLDRYGPVRRALLALLVLRAPLAILVRQACLESTAKTAATATTVRRVRLGRYGLVLRALLALLVLWALLAVLVRRACLELMVQTATMAPMVRQERPAILVQMGTMAQTATKVLRALKDPRATRVTKAMQVWTV